MSFMGYFVSAVLANWIFFPTFVLIFWLYNCKNQQKFPPGPRGLPFIGVVPFLGPRPEITFTKWAGKYGDIMGFKLGQSYTVVLSSWDIIMDAFGKNGHGQFFNHRPNNHMFSEVLRKNGIGFIDYTADYIRQRKFITATLYKLGFGKATMEERILEEVRHFLGEFEDKNINLNHATKEKIYLLMTNTIAQATIGKHYNDEDFDFRTIITGLLGFFYEGSSIYFATTLLPWLKHIPPIRGKSKAVKEGMEKIYNVIDKEIDEHEKTLDMTCTRDFIDEYLVELKKKSLTDENEPFSNEMLNCTVRDFFGGGSESTSSTIIFSFLVLANRPKIMKRIHGEIDDVLGSGQLPRFELRKNMPYLHAFITEIMRYRTVAPLSIPHCTSENINFRGYFIPKGTTVFPNLYAVHHDPSIWSEPHHFDPDRHLDSSGKLSISKHFAPFGIGSRLCAGWRLAEMELFIFLASVFRRYDVVPNPATEGERPRIEDDGPKSGMSMLPPANTPVTLVLRKV